MSAALWVGADDVMRATGWSRRTFFRKSKALPSRVAGGRALNGQVRREYSASALPGDAQLRLVSEVLRQPALPPAAEQAQGASREPEAQQILFSPRTALAINDTDRLLLTDEQQAIAEQRIAILRPLLDWSDKCARPTILLPGGREVRTAQDMADWLAAQHHVSARTIWGWLSGYRKRGASALVPKVRADKGGFRFFDRHPEMAAVAQAKFLQRDDRLSVRRCHEAVAELCREQQIDAPSYDTVLRYLESIPPAVAMLARDGEKQFQQRVSPFLLRDFKSEVNEIWVSDHVSHDVFVRNHRTATGALYFPGVEDGKLMRIWRTVILDQRSRKVVAHVGSAYPSSHTISTAFRRAVTTLDALCSVFYTDNGEDYKKLSRDLASLFSQIGIRQQHCIKYHPQSKLIESWNAMMHERFDKIWRPWYCGPKPDLCPEDCRAEQKRHKSQMKQGLADQSRVPRAADFDAMFSQWVEEYNSCWHHSGREMHNRTPDEVYATRDESKQRHMPANSNLDALFWERKQLVVREGGCVMLHRERYEPANDETRAEMYPRIEREVVVACDPSDLGEALVMDLDGRVIGKMRCQALIAHSPVSREAVQRGMREQRQVKKAVTAYIRAIEAMGIPSERSKLAGRTVMPTFEDLPRLAESAAASLPLAAAAGGGGRGGGYVEDDVADLVNDWN